MKEGTITKGIGGFYYISINEVIYECKARGIFRNKKIKPIIGDRVLINIVDEKNKLGNIEEILPRKNELIRPAVSNIDQLIIVFSMVSPQINLYLLDKFLIIVENKNIEPIICINKVDLVDDKAIQSIKSAYKNSNYKFISTSIKNGIGIDGLKYILKGKITAFSGPSGVGKSSLLNFIDKDYNLETGETSDKIKRGKHTTRHVELLKLENGGYVLDTPGFTSLYLDDIDHSELEYYYNEFKEYIPLCRFNKCSHTHEPNCAVKNAVEHGLIDKGRYERYVQIYNELS